MSRNGHSKNDQSERFKKLKPEFNRVYHLFNPALCFFARRLINDDQAAEDIVADVFVKFWQKQFEFKTVYNAKAFLYISTRNACINHNHKVNYQSRIRERAQHFTNEFALTCLNEYIYKDVVYLVYTIINELPDKCKQVMLMSFLDGSDSWQIAEQMKISVHTVRNQKSRGIKLIKNSDSFQFLQELWESLYEHRLALPNKIKFQSLTN
jgi:RNA polymerase sigma-70 factor (family 1)